MNERPHCSHCEKPLYRSAAKGTLVPRGATYIVCRNKQCPGKQKLQRVGGRRLRPKNPKRGVLAEAPKKTVPAGFISAQRERVREFVKQVADGEESASVALLLAMACEETGNVEAAAILSVKHRLDLLGYQIST